MLAAAPEAPASRGDTEARMERVLSAIERVCASNSSGYARRVADGQRIEIPLRARSFVRRYGPDDPEPITVFHSRVLPRFSLSRLNTALYHPRWCFDSTTTLQASVLMLRYSECTGVPVTTAMVHRLFLAAMLVSTKAHHDIFPRNDAFAQACGLPLWEMNRLELAVLNGCAWAVQVPGSAIDLLVAQLDATTEDHPSPQALTREGTSRAVAKLPPSVSPFALTALGLEQSMDPSGTQHSTNVDSRDQHPVTTNQVSPPSAVPS